MNPDKLEEGKIWSLEAKCPRCGSKFMITEYLHIIPLIGKVIISSGKCSSCGYMYKDVRAAESHGPQKIKISVDSPKDLNIIVVRAGTASIYIPELGISITPGPASEGFITTIEGVLNRIKEVMELLKDDPDVDRGRWSYRMDMVERALRGEIRFTLIIEDPEGVSRIVSDKAEKETLYKA